MKSVGHIARKEEGRSAIKKVNLKERDHYVGLGLDKRTILEWILKKLVSIR